MEAQTIDIRIKQVATTSAASSSASMVRDKMTPERMMIMMSSSSTSWTPATAMALFIRYLIVFPSTIKTTQNTSPPVFTVSPKSINNENNQPPGKQLYLHHILKSTITRQLQLLLFIFALLIVSHIGCTTATPVPSITPNSGPSSKHETELTGSSSSSSGTSEGVKQQSVQSVQQQLPAGGASSNHLENNLANSVSKAAAAAAPQMVGKTNTAEKLKRGLTNFMNQLNPAPFFVPPQPSIIQVQQQQQQQQQQAGGDKTSPQPNSSSAEPATIVNSDSSLVLKGPANRWAFARPIGGPLRWGKR